MDIFSRIFSHARSVADDIYQHGVDGQAHSELIDNHIKQQLRDVHGTDDLEEIGKKIGKRDLKSEIWGATKKAEKAHPFNGTRHQESVHNSNFTRERLADNVWGWKNKPKGTKPPLYKRMGGGLLKFGETAAYMGFNAAVGATNLAFKVAGRSGAGFASNLGGIAGGLGRGAVGFASSVEYINRVALTGTIKGGVEQNMLKAWLPGFNRYGWNDLRKYSLNTTVMKRMALGALGGGMVAGLREVVTPKIAPPQYILGAGDSIRHRNDMGMNAAYGQAMLGANSNLNLPAINPQSVARGIDLIW